MLATQNGIWHTGGRIVPRMLHVNEAAGDLLNKLEAVRILCQETGCAQRYLAHDALNALAQVSARIDDARGSREHRARFDVLPRARAGQTTSRVGIAMTDAKGDRSKRPARAGQRRHLRARGRAQRQGHHDLGRQGDRHVGAVHARVAGDAVPEHGQGGRRLRRVLCGSGRRAGHHDDRAARRPPGREARARRGAVLAQVRPVDRRRGVRPRVRPVGARVLRGRVGARMGTQRHADLQLRDPSPPELHRGACRLRRPADRRRRADVRGQRLRSRREVEPARADGRADQDRRGLLRLRRGGERLRRAAIRTAAPSCRSRCSRTSASC